MQNAPTFAVNNILAELQAMEQRINTRFDQVDAKLLACERNSAARVANSFLTAATDALTPLNNPSDNTRLAAFPETSEEIGLLTRLDLHALLRALNLPSEGDREAREQRFRQAIGLRRLRGA